MNLSTVAMPAEVAEPEKPSVVWSVGLRAVVSLALAYHLLAVLVHPLSVPPQFAGQPAILPTRVRPAFQPYITALSLDHSYKFFAPNPGDSHLVRYDLHFADGTKQINDPKNTFPDVREHWPRLLYHRYFMLAEHLAPLVDRMPPAGQPQDDPRGGELVPPAPNAAGEAVPSPNEPNPGDVFLRGIARHLAKKHGASRVDLYYRVHFLSSPEQILAGKKLDDPESYAERLVMTYKSEDVR